MKSQPEPHTTSDEPSVDALGARLRIIWTHSAPDENGIRYPWRYVPWATSDCWMVYDRKTQRLLDEWELIRIPRKTLAEEMHYDC